MTAPDPITAEERAEWRWSARNAQRVLTSERWPHSNPARVLRLLDALDALGEREDTRAEVERLIERSSLGTEEAKAARESVPREVGIAIATAARHLGRAKGAEAELADLRQRIEALRAEWIGWAQRREAMGIEDGQVRELRARAEDLRALLGTKATEGGESDG